MMRNCSAYELHLFKIGTETDLSTVFEKRDAAFWERQAKSGRIQFIQPELHQKLAGDLKIHFSLHHFKTENGIIVLTESTSSMQLTFFDDEIQLTIPLRYQDSNTKATFDNVWTYLNVIQRYTGYSVYNPQLDKVIDLSNDLPSTLANFNTTAEAVFDPYELGDE